MSEQEKNLKRRRRSELVTYLRKLAKWRNNDAVKLVFLEKEDLDLMGELDLSGVAELKRSANGAFEVKFVDRVRVLAMLRELLGEEDGGELGEILDSLRPAEDGDEV